MSTVRRLSQSVLAATGALALAIFAGAAGADTYSVSVSNTMDLGIVAAATSGATTFRINPQSGQVSQIGGGGRRMSNTLARVLVTIQCANDNNKYDNWDHDSGSGNNKLDCSKTKIGVGIGSIGIVTGRAQPLTNFTVSMTSASLAGAVSGTNPIGFTINPIGNGQTRSFYVGADFPIAGDDSGRSTGLGLAPFFVAITDPSGNVIDTALSAGTVYTYRALSISKTSDLQFGIVSQAKTSGTVTINPTTGARTITGGGFGYPNPPWSAAAFTISGEGGQTFSVSYPSTIQLSGPTNLNVQTTSNITGTPVLSGFAGSSGSYALKIGGSFPIANGSIVGTYSANWTVTVDYN